MPPIKTSGVEIFRHPLNPSGCDFHIRIYETKPGGGCFPGTQISGPWQTKAGVIIHSNHGHCRVVVGNPVPDALRTAIIHDNDLRRRPGHHQWQCLLNVVQATFAGGNEGNVGHDQIYRA
jgi:hypothetical protein